MGEWRAVSRHRVAERASRAVYLTIVALAIIVALEEAGTDVPAWEVVASTVGATIITALADLYSRYIAEAIRNRELAARELRDAAVDTAAGAVAALVPVVPFVFAGAGTIEDDTAYDIAAWLGLGVLAGYTLFANRAAGLTGARGLLTAGAVVLLGFALIALKALVH
jgi:hypothetical protein